MSRNHLRWSAPLAALAIFGAACTDRTPTDANAGGAEASRPLAAVACEVDMRAGTMECGAGTAAAGSSSSGASRTGSATGGRPSLDVITVGGQESYIRVATAGPQTRTDNGDGTVTWTGPVTVSNLMSQPIGTPNGTTATGVRVFFSQQPVVTNGTGTVEVVGNDGVGTFTASGQPYYQYSQIIEPGTTSAPDTWGFRMPATVDRFAFQVLVRAEVPGALAARRWQRDIAFAPTTQTLNDVSTAGGVTWAVGNGGVILRSGGSGYLPVASGTAANLLGVWASSASNAAAVGSTNAGAGVALRYDGSVWAADPLPAGTLALRDVWTSGPNDVWAVATLPAGAPATILHKTAAGWAVEPLPLPAGTTPNGVWGSGPSNVYVGASNGALLRYDGTSWTTVATAAGPLGRVWGSGPTDVYALSGGAALHWNGTSATTESIGFGVTAISGTGASSVVAVGVGGAAWARQSNGTWVAVETNTQRSLNGLSGFTAVGDNGTVMSGSSLTGTDVWRRVVYPVTLRSMAGNSAVGAEGTRVLVNNGTWSFETPCYGPTPVGGTRPTNFDLNTGFAGYYGTSAGIARVAAPQTATSGSCQRVTVTNTVGGLGFNGLAYYAVAYAGTYYVGGSAGAVVTLSGGTTGTGEFIPQGFGTVFAMWTDGTYLWAGGPGLGLRKRFLFGGSWMQEFVPVSPLAVAAISPTNVFAVGSGGAIWRYDGSTWTTMTSGTTNTLNAVWGTSPADVYAVGDRGTILHFDGTQWTREESGTDANLTGVGGVGAGEVYAVGTNSTVLRRQ